MSLEKSSERIRNELEMTPAEVPFGRAEYQLLLRRLDDLVKELAKTTGHYKFAIDTAVEARHMAKTALWMPRSWGPWVISTVALIVALLRYR